MYPSENHDLDRALELAQTRTRNRAVRRRRMFAYGTGALTTAAAAAVIITAVAGQAQRQAAIEGAAQRPIEGIQPYTVPSPQAAATTGDKQEAAGNYHARAETACTTYAAPVEEGLALHALEHGAVLLTYHPNLPEKEIRQLEDIAASYPSVLLSPTPGQSEPVTATAWNVRLEVQGAEDERIEPFNIKYSQNPQAPEPGATCTGAATG